MKTRILAALFIVFAFNQSIIYANTIKVPEDRSTIHGALEIASSGDTILVSPGLYEDSLVISGLDVHIISEFGPDSTIIRLKPIANVGIRFDGVESGSLIGFTFTKDSSRGFSTLINLVESSVRVERNRFIDLVILGSAIAGGASLESDVRSTIARNLFVNVEVTNALCVFSGGAKVDVVNNTVYNSGIGFAIYSPRSTVKNNILAKCGRYGIFRNGFSVEVAHNVYWQNTTNNWTEQMGIGDRELDPLFVSPADLNFELQDVSPCIDGGDPLLSFIDSDGTRNDIGLYPLLKSEYPSVKSIAVGVGTPPHVSSEAPIISWKYSDTSSTQAAYSVGIATDSSFNSLIWESGEVSLADSSVVYSGNPLDEGVTYFLRIRVSDGLNWSAWRGGSFTRNNSPPPPALLEPAVGAMRLVNNLELVVTVDTDLDHDGLTCDFELASDAAFSEIVRSYSGIETINSQATTGLVLGLQGERGYWWRVRTFDSYNFSEWSATGSFFLRGGRVIIVPDDFTLVQDAILNAETLDTVLVRPGTYNENIILTGKRISMISEMGALMTILKPADSALPTISVNDLPTGTSQINGFTFSDGSTAIQLNGIAGVEILNNILRNNAGVSPVIEINSSPISLTEIHNNVFSQNKTAGCVVTNDGWAYIYNNTFVNNAIGLKYIGGVVSFTRNIVTDNSIAGIDGSITLAGNNIFFANEIDHKNGASTDSNDKFVDPLLVNVAEMDYRLRFGSPCIDAGSSSIAMDPDGTSLDLGANYFDQSFPLAATPIVSGENSNRVTSDNPQFAWEYVDSLAPQSKYEIQLNSKSDWSGVDLWTSGEITSSDSFATYTGNPLDDGKRYFVRSRAHNGFDWGVWSEFTFQTNNMPTIPVLANPTANDTVNADEFTLEVWNANDVDDDSLSYQFEVYSDNSLTVLELDVSPVLTDSLKTSSGALGGLLPELFYWWRARSFDGFEYSSWTPADSFFTSASGVVHLVPSVFPSIQLAIDAAASGDTILVSAGDYHESLNFNGKSLVIKSTDGRDVTSIEPIAERESVVSFVSGETRSAVFDGFHLKGATFSPVIDCQNSSPTILNCRIDSSASLPPYYGYVLTNFENSGALVQGNVFGECLSNEVTTVLIRGQNGRSFELLNNLIEGATNFYTIDIRGAAKNVLISRNVILNTTRGIFNSGDDVEISNNTLVTFNSSLFGSVITQSAGVNVRIISNILYTQEGAQVAGVNVHNGASATVANNLLWGNTTESYWIPATLTDPGYGIIGNPRFVDVAAGDFNLQSGSAAIDAGFSDSAYMELDGTRSDVGAFAFMHTQPAASEFRLVNEIPSRVTSKTPVFSWVFVDSSGTQTRYELEVGSDSDWSVAELWSAGEISSNAESVTYAGAELAVGQEYFARIRVRDEATWGSWSEQSFRMNNPPNVPIPVSPSDGEAINSKSILLSMKSATEIDGDITKYFFQVSESVGFDSVIIAFDSLIAPQQRYPIDTEFVVTPLLNRLVENTTYYWRSRSFDGFEFSSWSLVQSFDALPAGLIRVPQDYATIQEGIDAAGTFDTVMVAPGIYHVSLTIKDKSISLLSSAGADSTILRPLTPEFSFPRSTMRVSSGFATETMISGFTFDSSQATMLAVSDSARLVVSGNVFKNHSSSGEVFYASSTSSFIIKRNIFTKNQGFNTIGHSSPAMGIVENNTFYDNRNVMSNPNYVTVRNNIIVKTSQNTFNSIASNFSFNVYFDNEADLSVQAAFRNNIFSDPHMNDPEAGDFSLTSESPAIDAGYPDSVAFDSDGTRADIGAIEYLEGYPRAAELLMSATDLSRMVNHTPEITWRFIDTSTSAQTTASVQTLYQIEVGSDNDWSEAELWNSGVVTSSDSSVTYAGAELLDSQKYYVRVRLSSASNWGEWMSREFRMNSIPEPPIARSPVNGSLSLVTNTRLVVTISVDNEGDRLTYGFELYNDSSLANLIFSGPAVDQRGDSAISALIPALEVGRRFYWRSQVSDGYELSSWSDVASFVTRGAGVIHVPADVSSIQAAIDLSIDGEVIIVASGTYVENISFLGRKIVLLAESGPESTLIQAANPSVPIVIFDNGEDTLSVLDGFSIRGTASAAGIRCFQASPIIRNCDISECISTGLNGGGIALQWSGAKIRNNRLHHNHAGRTGGGIGVSNNISIGVEITNNEVFANTAQKAGGIGIIGARGVLVKGNHIHDNQREGIFLSSVDDTVLNNTILNNGSGIVVIAGAGNIIFNNLIANSSSTGFVPANATVGYNLTWQNASFDDPGAFGINADPLFEIDNTLSPLSPCVDAGHPAHQFNDPNGTRNDIGAFPFESALPIASLPNLGDQDLQHVVSHSPNFNWTYISKSDPQTAYEIEVGTDRDWTVAEMWSSGVVTSNSEVVTYAGSELLDGTDYFYRIRVTDGSTWGDWLLASFHMNKVASPSTHGSPAGGERRPTDFVRLYVPIADDTESDVVNYEFQVFSDSLLTEPVSRIIDFNQDDDSVGVDYLTDLSVDASYWWRYRITDDFEFSNWSEFFWFRTRGPATVSVPLTSTTIAGAIAIVGPQDTISVGPGEYRENLRFDSVSIVLVSEGGASVTTIISDKDSLSVMLFVDHLKNTSVVRGFTIRGARGVAGINIGRSNSVSIEDCVVTDNLGRSGLQVGNSLSMMIRGCSFIGNSTVSDGGGVNVGNTPSTSITDCIFLNNSAGDEGGAIYIRNSDDSRIVGNLIANNTTQGDEAAVHSFINNNILIEHNTITNNRSTFSAPLSSGVTLAHTWGILKNNIITYNSGGKQVFANSASKVTASYNNIYFGEIPHAGLILGVGNLSLPPGFVDTASGSFGLRENSIGINAADPADPDRDPDGTRRETGSEYRPLTLPVVAEFGAPPDELEHMSSHLPIFQWTYFDTALSQAQGFEVQVGSDNQWSVAELWSTGVTMGGLTSTTYAGQPLLDGVRYYLRVRVRSSDRWGDWITRSFFMNPAGPMPPTLVYPVNDDSPSVSHPIFIVKSSPLNDSAEVSYGVALYFDSNLTVPFHIYDSLTTFDDRHYTPPLNILLVGVPMWWRARAFDGYEYSEWSESGSFIASSGGILDVPSLFPKINFACGYAEVGDTVMVGPGEYEELISLVDKSIVLMSGGGPQETILRAPANNTLAFAIIRAANTSEGVTVSGFTFDGANSRSGIVFERTTNELVSNNVFHSFDNGLPAIFVSEKHSAKYMTISNNQFYDNSSGCAYFRKAPNIRVINNTFTSSSYGLFLERARRIVIQNNIITQMANDGIRTIDQSLIDTLDYNNFWGNRINFADGIPIPHNITEAPLFVDEMANNYSLNPASPCINTGNPHPDFNDPDGSRNDIGAIPFNLVTDVVSDETEPILPLQFELSQNYPNPFNPSTTINYALPHKTHVNISIYNIIGQRIVTLVDDVQPAGWRSVEWDGKVKSNDAASGMYFYRIETAEIVLNRKMILLK